MKFISYVVVVSIILIFRVLKFIKSRKSNLSRKIQDEDFVLDDEEFLENPNEPKKNSGKEPRKKCFYCHRPIDTNVWVCPFCGKKLG